MMGSEQRKPTDQQIGPQTNRRDFLKFCGLIAATLAYPGRYADRIARALTLADRLPIIWLNLQDCTGDSESLLRASVRQDPLNPGLTDPAITDILFDYISLEYHETLMAASGSQSELALMETMQNYPGEYICIVEGSIPLADNGVYCVVGGRTALSIVQEVTGGARAAIAVGTCATDGGLAAAEPNLTGADGLENVIPGLTELVNLPGCPVNVVNLVATLVHLITFDALPPVDNHYRPLFAYGDTIHHNCERKGHHDNDRFVMAWGDAGHQQGWCLKEMGCRGPQTRHNCPVVGWNESDTWPVAAGHNCIGCAEAGFWDQFSPFYER